MRVANFLANKLLTTTANLLFGHKITDEATAFKLFRTDLLRSLSLDCDGFEFCPIALCFLHSDESAEIEMTLKRDGSKDVLRQETRPNPETRPVVGRIIREFLRNAHRLGAVPLITMLEFMQPGQGFHTGWSFPMRAEPKAFESDRLGRPYGW